MARFSASGGSGVVRYDEGDSVVAAFALAVCGLRWESEEEAFGCVRAA